MYRRTDNTMAEGTDNTMAEGTDNTMAEGKGTKRQAMILRRKIKIELQEPHTKPGLNSGVPEW